MTDPVTLLLPESLLQQARELAAITDQPLEAVLISWLEFAHQHQPARQDQAGAELAESQPDGAGAATPEARRLPPRGAQASDAAAE